MDGALLDTVGGAGNSALEDGDSRGALMNEDTHDMEDAAPNEGIVWDHKRVRRS